MRPNVIFVAELERLLTTSELARLLQIDRRTVQRWVEKKIITPTFVMPGGGFRWDPADVREQLHRKGEDGR